MGTVMIADKTRLCFFLFFLQKKQSQKAHDLMTSHGGRCDVVTSYRRRCDVISTSGACRVKKRNADIQMPEMKYY